jgi:hypothetical protein
MTTTGTRVITAYGRHPAHVEVDGEWLVGEFGTIVRVNADGWHDVRLDSGELLALNPDRYQTVDPVAGLRDLVAFLEDVPDGSGGH